MEATTLRCLKVGDTIKIKNIDYIVAQDTSVIKNGKTYCDTEHSILATKVYAPFHFYNDKVDYTCVDYSISKYRQWLNLDKEKDCFVSKFEGQLDTSDNKIPGFLFNMPSEFKKNLNTFPIIEYYDAEKYETLKITNEDKVCMASAIELGYAESTELKKIGIELNYFKNSNNSKNVNGICTRTPKDNDTYQLLKYEKDKLTITWGFNGTYDIIALLYVNNAMKVAKVSDGVYKIWEDEPAKISVNKANDKIINVDITGGCDYDYTVKFNNTIIKKGTISDEQKNFDVITFNDELNKFKLNDEINIDIIVACKENATIKTEKKIKYKKNIHNIDKIKQLIVNNKLYNIKTINVDNSGKISVELENYNDKSINNNVIYIVDGKADTACISNIDGKSENLECNLICSTFENFTLEDKYEIQCKNPNNNFDIKLNCEGIYDKKEQLKGIMGAFQYFSEQVIL